MDLCKRRAILSWNKFGSAFIGKSAYYLVHP